MRFRALLALPLVTIVLGMPTASEASTAPLNQWHLIDPYIQLGPKTLLAIPGHGLYRLTFGQFEHSADGGATWDVRSTPPCGESTMAVDPNDPSRIYVGCAYGGGMLRSTDGGATWTAANTGLMYPSSTVFPTIAAIAIDPSDSSVYITTQGDELGADVFASHDGGDSWTPIHAGSWGYGIAVSGGRIYAFDTGGDIVTNDGGATWSSFAPLTGTNSLLADPEHPGTVYALGQYSGSPGQAWATTDGGGHWTQLTSAPAGITSASVVDGDLYLGSNSGVYQSTDEGQTWTQTETATNNGQLQIDAVAADPAVPGHVWALDEETGLWEVTFDSGLVPGQIPYYAGGTLPVTNITPTSALLHGVIAATAPGVTGLYSFWWGTTSFYGNETARLPWPDASHAGAESEVTAPLTGLEPDTTYHVRLFALSSWVSMVRPDDVTFTTPSARAPSAADLRVSLRHATVAAETLPIHLRWVLRAGTYRICSQTLQLRIDGGAFHTIAHPAPGARAFATSLDPGHGYAVRVRAADCSHMHSTWATTAFTMRRPAGAPRATFGPGWIAATGLHTATSAGARATLSFTGREVGIVALTGRAYGRAAVYLDGEQVATLDLHAHHPAQRRMVFRMPVASLSTHSLVVRVLSDSPRRAVAIESFAVLR